MPRQGILKDGEICGRLYSTAQPICLRWKSGIIAEMAACAEADGADRWLAPALLDLQINGYSGVDLQQDKLDVEDLSRAVTGLQNAGCSQFLWTLMTDRWDSILDRLREGR